MKHGMTRWRREWVLVCVLVVTGCAGYSDRTRDARAALDAGRTQDAVALFNERLDVKSEKELPSDLKGEKVLFVLERAVALQSLRAYDLSSRDLEVADKQIEVADFTHGTLDDISKYMFSDDSGPYQAPPYEKLMINTLNMVNYLVRGDLNGARVEARRLAVMQQFISEHEAPGLVVGGPGSYLAGFTFEKSHEPGEAMRYYDEALAQANYSSLAAPLRRLAKLDGYRTDRIRAALGKGYELAEHATPDDTDDWAEVLVVVSYGRVPAKVAERIPVGLALTLASSDLSAGSRGEANRLAAQGLVTWVNFPSLPNPRPIYQVPTFAIDHNPMSLEGLLAVDAEAVKAWSVTKGKMIASAITRLITRLVAGEAARRVAGKGTLGFLASLGTQITLTATDTPDTRSWSTLPARIAVGRVRIPPGQHVIDIAVSGQHQQKTVNLEKKGWAVLSLTVLH
jgi:hypothetical protein